MFKFINKFHNKKKQKGFTMVELLFVIAVIAILVIAFFLKNEGIIFTSKAISATQMFNTIQTAVLSYWNDFGVYPDDLRCLYNKDIAANQLNDINEKLIDGWVKYIEAPANSDDQISNPFGGYFYIDSTATTDINNNGKFDVCLIVDNVPKESLIKMDKTIDRIPDAEEGKFVWSDNILAGSQWSLISSPGMKYGYYIIAEFE